MDKAVGKWVYVVSIHEGLEGVVGVCARSG